MTLRQAINRAARLARDCDDRFGGYGIFINYGSKGYRVEPVLRQHLGLRGEIAWVPAGIRSIQRGKDILCEQIPKLVGRQLVNAVRASR